MQEQIRVGIVGANAKKSWASLSHVSAIKGLTGLKLPAVATRNEQSAREASEAFGADRWFSDPLAMIDDDQIDVITISGRRGRFTSYRDRIAGTFESSCAAGGPICFLLKKIGSPLNARIVSTTGRFGPESMSWENNNSDPGNNVSATGNLTCRLSSQQKIEVDR